MFIGTIKRTSKRLVNDVRSKEKPGKISNNDPSRKQPSGAALKSKASTRVKRLGSEQLEELNQSSRSIIDSTESVIISTEDKQSSTEKRKLIEDNDDLGSNKSRSMSPPVSSSDISPMPSTTSTPPPSTNISTSSITILPADQSIVQPNASSISCLADTSSKASSENSINSKETTKPHTCRYRVPCTTVPYCQNQGTYQCSHCNILYCLQHGLQHQDDLKVEIRGLLTKTQELFDNVQKQNFLEVKASCLTQIDQWVANIHAKIDQIRAELQTTLTNFESQLQERHLQLKGYLREELERKVAGVLTEQLQTFEINKSQVEQATSEFTRLKLLLNSFNNRQLITMVLNSENQLNLCPPSLVCSDILFDRTDFSNITSEKIHCTDEQNDQMINEKESLSNPTTEEVTDISNVTHTSAEVDTHDPMAANSANDISIDLLSQLPADQTVFIPGLFDEHVFETAFEHVLIEEVVSSTDKPEEPALSESQSAMPSSSNSNITLKKLSSNKKENSRLDLTGQNLVDQDIPVVIRYALHNTKLTQPFRTLDISSNQIESRGIQALCNELEKNLTLEKLHLHSNQIHNQGAQYIGSLLQKNSTLLEVDISRNHIGEQGMISFSNGLKENKTLTVLNLEQNLIGHRGAQSLCSALQHNNTLQSLNLNGCCIQEIGAQYVSKLLRVNSSINVLQLAGNQLGETGALCFVHVLRQNTTLTTLNFQSNQLGEIGALYISDGLRNNKTLRELNLAQNQLGDSGTRSICNALHRNRALTTLNLSDNEIRKYGAQYIGSLIFNNRILTNLDCSCNEVQSGGSLYIRDALRKNKTLTTFNLEENRIGQQGVQSLIDAITDNKTLLTFNLKKNNISANEETMLNEKLTGNKRRKDMF